MKKKATIFQVYWCWKMYSFDFKLTLIIGNLDIIYFSRFKPSLGTILYLHWWLCTHTHRPNFLGNRYLTFACQIYQFRRSAKADLGQDSVLIMYTRYGLFRFGFFFLAGEWVSVSLLTLTFFLIFNFLLLLVFHVLLFLLFFLCSNWVSVVIRAN